MNSTAFITPLPLTLRPLNNSLTAHKPRLTVAKTLRMIQTPFGEGPPNLDTFLDPTRKRADPSGPPITIGTARTLLSKHDSVTAAAEAAFATASASVPGAQLGHVSYSLDVNAEELSNALKKVLGDVPLIGRSVDKKDSEGTIELLLFHSAAPGGIALASASAPASADVVEAVSRNVAERAAKEALGKLEGDCRFMVFCHSPGSEKAVREGFDNALKGVVAYGGPAIGGEGGWSMIDEDDDICVKVAAIPGSISFLLSAVVKNWMQPAYTEMLGFMKPRYTDDLGRDLLTAIRYEDWDKFTECLDAGVDVNIKWEDKQNQIPLLAACARGRVEMVAELLKRGGDVNHRNDGGFTAVMYVRMLTEYDRGVVDEVLRLLKEYGADLQLKRHEMEMLKRATGGKIIMLDGED